MIWKDALNADPLPWLLEEDLENLGVLYLSLTQLLSMSPTDPKAEGARRGAMEHGPIPKILAEQEPDGYWVEPGPGYSPKYRGTCWQVIFLAQLGASGEDIRVRAACDYVLNHTQTERGGLSATGKPSGLIHCLQGNLLAALIDLGHLSDPRVTKALDWLARSITGEGIAPSSQKDASTRYLRSGNSAPGFICSSNNHLPCAWGAVKAMLALSKVPKAMRTPAVNDAIDSGIEFLLSRDPSIADYPMGYSEKPNRSWYRFGFPVGYVTDVLQNLEVLTTLGLGDDPRLEAALQLVLNKQNALGRWTLEYTYNGKTWAEIEALGVASKWVTLRAMRVLVAAGLPL